MNLKKLARTTGVSFLAVSAAAPAFAAGTLTDLTSAVSFTDLGLGIIAIAGSIIAYKLLERGAVKVIAFMNKA